MSDESNKNHSSSNAGALILAFLGGAAAGAAAVALTTPKSGPETRQQVSSLAHKSRNSVNAMPDALREATTAAQEAFLESMKNNGAEIEPVS